MENGKEFLHNYIKKHGLKKSAQRDKILDIFLSVGGHLSVDNLTEIVKEKHPEIGYSTIYRSLYLMQKAGIAERVELGDGITRYENMLGNKRHYHFVCQQCGKLIEFYDPLIESKIKISAAEADFSIERYRLDAFGVCSECRKKNNHSPKTKNSEG